MDLTHRFTVPTTVPETWDHFTDVAGLAECFPGATVTGSEGDAFEGSCKVKLGPISLVYQGAGAFVEKDEAARRLVVEAKGKDKRGNGTAGATVTLTMSDAADGGTDVEVLTDLSVTGKPAQFGRGVMQDVSDKLLGQFVDCLEQRLGGGREPAGAGAAAATVEPPETGTTGSAAPPASELGGAATGAAPPPRPADDALDLGATALPVIARAYWKQGLAALVVLLVVLRVLRRR